MTSAEKERRKQLLREQEAIRDRKVAKSRSPFQELEHRITSRAEELLEKPHLLPELAEMGSLHVILRLWNYPAFTPYKSWVVYRGAQQKNFCFLHEVAWDMLADLERIHSLNERQIVSADSTPSIQTRSIELSNDDFEDRFVELQQITLPVFRQNDLIGLDGETYGVATGDYFLNAQLSWWCEGPPEWHELIDWFHRMKNYFEDQLEKNQPQA